MIVTDNSAVVEVFTGASVDTRLLSYFEDESLAAPHLIDTEVLNTFRGLELGRKLSVEILSASRRDFTDLSIARYRIDALADRIWELRFNYNAYDASYIALAETLGVPLVTCDQKLASDLHGAEVVAFVV